MSNMGVPIRNVEVHVTVPVPQGGPESDVSVGAELLRLWLVEQVRMRRMSVGKAAELASVSQAEFMQILGTHGVPVIDYPVEDFDRELRGLGLA